MKKLFLILLIFTSLNAFSQLQVKEGSFRYMPGGVIDNKAEYIDGNDMPMALIKISTENINEQERLRLVFIGNRATQIIKKPKTGQMWIYISAEAATFIDIKHPDYGTCKYYLPEELCGYCVYEMVVQYIPLVNEAKQNYLIIKADQANADIYIDDKYVGKQFAHKQLTVGSSYNWRIECELFRTESGDITITDKENLVEVTMQPEYGYLNVTTSPENGALVYIDDVMVGGTPYKSDKMSVRDYTVKVVKDQFKTTEKIVTINDKKTTEENIEMQFLSGSLEISSYPTGVDVYIDGKHYGQTPKRITEIIIGTHELKLEKSGYNTLIKTFIVEDDNVYINESLEKIMDEKNSIKNVVSDSDIQLLVEGVKKDIEFYVEDCKDDIFCDKLYAKINGQNIQIEIPKNICIALEDQRDFDGDNITDALIRNIHGCGGNCCGDSFFFVKYISNGYFIVTNEFGVNVWQKPVMENWEGVVSVVFEDNVEHHKYIKKRYVFRGNKAELVEEIKPGKISAIKEILYTDFEKGKKDKITLSYDVDNDNVLDIIEATYWWRWDMFVCDIKMSKTNITYSISTYRMSKTNITYSIATYRLGILETLTNGVHDIVLGDNDILKWNGEEYIMLQDGY